MFKATSSGRNWKKCRPTSNSSHATKSRSNCLLHGSIIQEITSSLINNFKGGTPAVERCPTPMDVMSWFYCGSLGFFGCFCSFSLTCSFPWVCVYLCVWRRGGVSGSGEAHLQIIFSSTPAVSSRSLLHSGARLFPPTIWVLLLMRLQSDFYCWDIPVLLLHCFVTLTGLHLMPVFPPLCAEPPAPLRSASWDPPFCNKQTQNACPPDSPSSVPK